jgi:hypothetical protein
MQYTVKDTVKFYGCLRLQEYACAQRRASKENFASIFNGLLDGRGSMRTAANGSMAGELGFEPRQTESESVVLPLHHSPMDYRTNSISYGIIR